jgi:SAM-dependent methyltransferase
MPASRAPVYDLIGGSYARGRRADPQIAAAIRAALGGARAVLNVGAGGGSYEPRGPRVVAVEPSVVMIAQRPRDAAPAVRAVAEALPFPDGAFDAAMGVLTMHHWADRDRGLAEMRRVARRVVLFLCDPQRRPPWWLGEYFPATARLEAARETRLADVAGVLGPLEVIPVPIPGDCTDGFNGAYWRRPRDILDPAVWRPMSALSQIPDADRAAGMSRLRADLDSGAWDRRWGHLLGLAELDLGYCVVATRQGAGVRAGRSC